MQKHRTTVIDARDDISDEIRECWIALQKQNPVLQSPYFAPQFTQIVAAARDDVEVAVIRQGEEIVALFPFQRSRWNFARPVGSFISDYDGVICTPDFKFQPRELVRSCGLVAWDFSHVPVAQASVASFHYEQVRSPIMDLSAGFDAYIREQRETGTEQIKKSGNLMRRMEREVGPLRFVAHSTDRGLLAKLLAWKTEQFRRNRWRDLFSIPWVRQTIECIHGTQTPEFAGMLSAIYAGDQLVAAHFGMRSATVWHYWFPSYDQTYAKYSPGVTLLLKMAEAAQSIGIKTIDLGSGEHTYKERLMNGFVPTASGSVELTGPATLARRVWTPIRKLGFKTRCFVSKTPIGALARRIRDRAD